MFRSFHVICIAYNCKLAISFLTLLGVRATIDEVNMFGHRVVLHVGCRM